MSQTEQMCRKRLEQDEPLKNDRLHQTPTKARLCESDKIHSPTKVACLGQDYKCLEAATASLQSELSAPTDDVAA